MILPTGSSGKRIPALCPETIGPQERGPSGKGSSRALGRESHFRPRKRGRHHLLGLGGESSRHPRRPLLNIFSLRLGTGAPQPSVLGWRGRIESSGSNAWGCLLPFIQDGDSIVLTASFYSPPPNSQRGGRRDFLASPSIAPVMPSQDYDLPQKEQEKMTKFQEGKAAVINPLWEVSQRGIPASTASFPGLGVGLAGACLRPHSAFAGPCPSLEGAGENDQVSGYHPFQLDVILQLGKEDKLWLMETEIQGDGCSGKGLLINMMVMEYTKERKLLTTIIVEKTV
ncbi:hypothetical protein H8959_005931 [Pygathrix nigripes]